MLRIARDQATFQDQIFMSDPARFYQNVASIIADELYIPRIIIRRAICVHDFEPRIRSRGWIPLVKSLTRIEPT